MRILSVCLLFLLISCKASYQRVDINSISDAEKKKVYNFGKQVLETCKSRKFIQLGGRKVTKGLSELSLKDMQDACDVLDKRNGKFIDMDLVEVIEEPSVRVYRYKGKFEKNEFLNEIRIWLRSDGKFQGIIWQEWKDEYKPYKKGK